MFKEVVVKNFRCFSDLHLKDLARVNLIAGKNNTGKTALLEAIHLHCNPGNWPLPLDINKTRGIADPAKALEDVCGWLFWQKQAGGGLLVESRDEEGVSRTLQMWIRDAVTSRERFPEAEKALAMSLNPSFFDANLPRLVLQYEQPSETAKVSIGVAATMPGGATCTWVGGRIPWSMASVFLNSCVTAAEKDIKFFGELETAKRQEEILPALKILDERLERLALIPLAGELVIHGDIGLPRLVPLPFLGEGIRRVLSVVLAIANTPGGVVLIDEIENGLHYSVQKQVWQAIAQAARQADVQVFATTHSYECIQAANEAFNASGPYDLRLFRLDRSNGEIDVAVYDKEVLEYATEMSHEVR